MSTMTLIVGIVMLMFECQNLLSWWGGRTVRPGRAVSDDFTIVVPLYGHPRYFATGRDALDRYRANTLVAIDVGAAGMDAYADELAAAGFGVHRVRLEMPNPATLVSSALAAVTTSIVLRLDADTILPDDLPAAIAAFDASGADLSSVKVEAINTRRVIAKLQNLEYRIAMLTRHYRPWLTSGACIIARTRALRTIFAQHSHWTPGEDIETGRTAMALGLQIRHTDMVVHTEVPETWRALYRQRSLWWAGNFRHAIVNMDRNALHMPVMTAYWLLMIWTSVALKWWHQIDPHAVLTYLPLLYVNYLVITAFANVRVASPWMLVLPLYAFVQSLVMPPVGLYTYVRLAWTRRQLGRYRFGYRRGANGPSCVDRTMVLSAEALA
jgi:cellulose synthase/poly-beta-1,6-N-acetylglucosamine synthase-like glycosyltransferase